MPIYKIRSRIYRISHKSIQESLTDSLSVAVVYLARGVTAKERSAISRFIQSYNKFDAGYDHTLVIAKKDLIDDDVVSIEGEIGHQNVEFIDVPSTGFDIGTYIHVAKHSSFDFYLFLNTHSRILAPNWLLLMLNAFLHYNASLIGCSASYGLQKSSKELGVKRPNFHIRSNAFLISKDTLMRISREHSNIQSKEDTWAFEGGFRSMTKIAAEEGLVGVVNSSGTLFTGETAMLSNTFWISGQTELLIADNQTDKYQESNGLIKVIYTYAAWRH